LSSGQQKKKSPIGNLPGNRGIYALFVCPIWENGNYKNVPELVFNTKLLLRELPKNNIERKYYINPVRGEILDRNGKLLL